DEGYYAAAGQNIIQGTNCFPLPQRSFRNDTISDCPRAGDCMGTCDLSEGCLYNDFLFWCHVLIPFIGSLPTVLICCDGAFWLAIFSKCWTFLPTLLHKDDIGVALIAIDKVAIPFYFFGVFEGCFPFTLIILNDGLHFAFEFLGDA